MDMTVWEIMICMGVALGGEGGRSAQVLASAGTLCTQAPSGDTAARHDSCLAYAWREQ